ncbi:MAG: putative D,D-dipeptide-binding periplasmic protein DdpA [Alphaproteobacteria bacterium MarineAlpha2_Bin1]|nr:MAG: putative D,D-dipeptide-binding periplasmic protein DdpA [Alphaproteobacteria bacterium MarineAlpha2_Bin1]
MKNITFKLREGVKSHWGNELSANDIKWSWVRKLELGGIGGFFASIIGLNNPDQIQIVNKYVVSFKLDKPASLILKVHRNPRNYIYDSKKILESTNDDDPWGKKWISDNIAGFGPYKMVYLKREEKFIAEKHTEYWGKEPSIDRLVMLQETSSKKRAKLLLNKKVQIAQFLDFKDIKSLINKPEIEIDKTQSSNMVWINLNCSKPPFNNLNIRKAMNIIFPKKDAVNKIFLGYGRELKGVIPDFYPGYLNVTNIPDHDIIKARDLLKNEGYAKGFETYCIYDNSQFFMHPLLLLYKESLKKIDITLNLVGLEHEDYFIQLQSRSHPMKMTRYAPWCADTAYALAVSFLSSSLGNYTHYSNLEVDKLIQNALTESNYQTRLKYLYSIQKIISSDYPWVNICNPDFIIARSSNIKGWVYRTFNHTKAQDFYLSG